jgi:hypothetical protein
MQTINQNQPAQPDLFFKLEQLKRFSDSSNKPSFVLSWSTEAGSRCRFKETLYGKFADFYSELEYLYVMGVAQTLLSCHMSFSKYISQLSSQTMNTNVGQKILPIPVLWKN